MAAARGQRSGGRQGHSEKTAGSAGGARRAGDQPNHPSKINRNTLGGGGGENAHRRSRYAKKYPLKPNPINTPACVLNGSQGGDVKITVVANATNQINLR